MSATVDIDSITIDWGALRPLRLKAQELAFGVLTGTHRSPKRGAGVEFGGQRPYVAGDDLRFLDRRSLMRHDRLMVREFETETERAVWIVADNSLSMGFRSDHAPASKYAYASLLAAALCRVAIAGHDPVGLTWFGGGRSLPARSGRMQFERVVGHLESATLETVESKTIVRQIQLAGHRFGLGTVIVVFTDLFELNDAIRKEIAALGLRRRALVVVQVIDPQERDLSFDNKVNLQSYSGGNNVVTDAAVVRSVYQKRLKTHVADWRDAVQAVGGRLCVAPTDGDPMGALSRIVAKIAEARR